MRAGLNEKVLSIDMRYQLKLRRINGLGFSQLEKECHNLAILEGIPLLGLLSYRKKGGSILRKYRHDLGKILDEKTTK